MPTYAKGQSGNPAGRQKGAQDWRGRLRDIIEGRAPQIVERVILSALQGDTHAQRMLLDRLIPVRKPTEEPVKLVDLPPATLAKQGETVITAALRGKIAPERAAALLGALIQQARITETEDYERRLTELEKRNLPEGQEAQGGGLDLALRCRRFQRERIRKEITRWRTQRAKETR